MKIGTAKYIRMKKEEEKSTTKIFAEKVLEKNGFKQLSDNFWIEGSLLLIAYLPYQNTFAIKVINENCPVTFLSEDKFESYISEMKSI